MQNKSPIPYKRYVCLVCGYIYDEAEGHGQPKEESYLSPGTRWEDIPPNWQCPECGARKEEFELIETTLS